MMIWIKKVCRGGIGTTDEQGAMDRSHRDIWKQDTDRWEYWEYDNRRNYFPLTK